LAAGTPSARATSARSLEPCASARSKCRGRAQRRSRPVRWASICQGTRLAWCYISVTTTESPGPTTKRADSGPDVGQTLAMSILDVLDGINEFNSSEQGAALKTWDESS